MQDILLFGILFIAIAGVSYLLFAVPILNDQRKKQRIQQIVHKRREKLFQEMRQSPSGKKEKSAKDTLATAFRVQKLAGEMGERLRDKCFQAGYRSPQAPLVFLILKIALPVALTLITMLVLSLRPDPLPGALGTFILLAIAAFGFYLPGILLENQAVKRRQEIALSFPDALDMILICVQGGIGIEQAIERIAREVSEHSRVLAEELGILSAELSMLGNRKQAFQNFARRVGSGAARSFATAMVQAEQYGTSISQAMRVLAEDQRDQRMAEAERKAASLPPKLTVPMILFFLPSLFIVILGPAALQAMMLN